MTSRPSRHRLGTLLATLRVLALARQQTPLDAQRAKCLPHGGGGAEPLLQGGLAAALLRSSAPLLRSCEGVEMVRRPYTECCGREPMMLRS